MLEEFTRPAEPCTNKFGHQSTVDGEVVFRIQNQSKDQESTPRSPLHQSRTRFHKPNSGTWKSQEHQKAQKAATEENSTRIERKLLVPQLASSMNGSAHSRKVIASFCNPIAFDDEGTRAKYDSLQKRVRQLLQLGDDVGAEQCQREVLSLSPSHADSYFNLGAIEQFFRNDLEKAIEYYKLALEMDGDHTAARYNLAAVHFSLKTGKRECEGLLRDILFLEKQSCDAMYGLGMLYRGDNQQAAETWFRKVLDKDPNHQPTLQNYGNLLVQRGQVQQGNAFLRRCCANAKSYEALITHSLAYPCSTTPKSVNMMAGNATVQVASGARSRSLVLPVATSAQLDRHGTELRRALSDVPDHHRE